MVKNQISGPWVACSMRCWQNILHSEPVAWKVYIRRFLKGSSRNSPIVIQMSCNSWLKWCSKEALLKDPLVKNSSTIESFRNTWGSWSNQLIKSLKTHNPTRRSTFWRPLNFPRTSRYILSIWKYFINPRNYQKFFLHLSTKAHWIQTAQKYHLSWRRRKRKWSPR